MIATATDTQTKPASTWVVRTPAACMPLCWTANPPVECPLIAVDPRSAREGVDPDARLRRVDPGQAPRAVAGGGRSMGANRCIAAISAETFSGPIGLHHKILDFV